jgi:hypothetical protein
MGSGTAESRTRVRRTPCAEDTATPRSRTCWEFAPAIKPFDSPSDSDRTRGAGFALDSTEPPLSPVKAHAHAGSVRASRGLALLGRARQAGLEWPESLPSRTPRDVIVAVRITGKTPRERAERVRPEPVRGRRPRPNPRRDRRRACRDRPRRRSASRRPRGRPSMRGRPLRGPLATR